MWPLEEGDRAPLPVPTGEEPEPAASTPLATAKGEVERECPGEDVIEPLLDVRAVSLEKADSAPVRGRKAIQVAHRRCSWATKNMACANGLMALAPAAASACSQLSCSSRRRASLMARASSGSTAAAGACSRY